jgi:hypothetical protein
VPDLLNLADGVILGIFPVQTDATMADVALDVVGRSA